MQTQFYGQVAIVTGVGKGYEAGIAERLRDAGAKVWITGRDKLALEAAASRLGGHGGGRGCHEAGGLGCGLRVYWNPAVAWTFWSTTRAGA